jgi:hypothetical protein
MGIQDFNGVMGMATVDATGVAIGEHVERGSLRIKIAKT